MTSLSKDSSNQPTSSKTKSPKPPVQDLPSISNRITDSKIKRGLSNDQAETKDLKTEQPLQQSANSSNRTAESKQKTTLDQSPQGRPSTLTTDTSASRLSNMALFTPSVVN